MSIRVDSWFAFNQQKETKKTKEVEKSLDTVSRSDRLLAMPATVEQLAEEAIALPEDQRLTLAHRILATLEPPISADIEEAWEREIIGRIKKFKEGTSKTVPAEEVFAELDDALKK